LDKNMPRSDLTIILDVPVQVMGKRSTSTGANRFEQTKEFIERVREIFLALAEREKWKVIDADRSKVDIHQDIIKIVEDQFRD
jgi:dTMP kinase